MQPVTHARIATVNFNYGGIDPVTGDDADAQKTIIALNDVQPHVVLGQEIWAPPPTPPSTRLWDIANALGMTAVLGPITPGARSPLHTAILIDTDALGAEITCDDPAPGHIGPTGTAPAWVRVELRIAALAARWDLYAGHLPARSPTMQLAHAESLAARIAEHHQPTIVGADFNGYAALPHVTSEELENIPRHLQVSRCRRGPDGRLERILDVHDTLTRAGLIDVAADLPPGCRVPADLQPTGHGGARVDRIYATAELADAATRYWQFPIGSDHDAAMVEMDLTQLEATT